MRRRNELLSIRHETFFLETFLLEVAGRDFIKTFFFIKPTFCKIVTSRRTCSGVTLLLNAISLFSNAVSGLKRKSRIIFMRPALPKSLERISIQTTILQ